mmetsp:Transcript_13661/g.21342  ORF Transcript_13661/g.21342 Transcript_13661/m.21342 type:complete len:123 (-) Transcript_13661:1045-1413(-)
MISHVVDIWHVGEFYLDKDNDDLRLLHAIMNQQIGTERRIPHNHEVLVGQVVDRAMLTSTDNAREDKRYHREIDLPFSKVEQPEAQGRKGLGSICSIPLKGLLGNVYGVLQVALMSLSKCSM